MPTFYPGQKIKINEFCGDFVKGEELIVRTNGGEMIVGNCQKFCCHIPTHWLPVEPRHQTVAERLADSGCPHDLTWKISQSKPQTLAELLVGKRVEYKGVEYKITENHISGLSLENDDGVILGGDAFKIMMLDPLHYDPPKHECVYRCESCKKIKE